MDGTPRLKPERDKAFDFSKVPIGQPATQVIDHFLRLITTLELRQRARRAEDQERHVAMASALVLDLAHRALSKPGGWLAVSLASDEYSRQSRGAAWFMTPKFVDLLNLLAHAGPNVLEMRRAAPKRGGTGERTTVRAGARLLEMFQQEDLLLVDIGRNRRLLKDALVLKGPKVRGVADLLQIPDNEETRRLRAEVDAINDCLETADIGWAGNPVEDKVDLSDKYVYRVFNNGSLRDGGRLFGGFWHCPDKLEYVCFGEHRAVALDYGQMGVRSAYVMAGKEPPAGDLYAIPGMEAYREGVKTVLSALLAADKLPTRFPRGVRKKKLFPPSWTFSDAFKPIAEFHHLIRDSFGTGMCYRQMYEESCLIIKVLLRLKDCGVVALPVHDGILVSQDHRTTAEDTLLSEFKAHFGVDGAVGVSYPTTTITIGSTLSLPYVGGVSA